MEIEFSTHEDYYLLKENFPTPIKLNIPEWYKKLEHGTRNTRAPEYENMIYWKTVKGCMPFLETLTSGYLLRLPVDYFIQHGTIKDDDGTPVVKVMTSLESEGESMYQAAKGLNINALATHHPLQLEGSPFFKKNGGLAFSKITNPWHIKTPPGYSCLFLNPLNNEEQDRFSIIPGIVHTDQYQVEVNFPIVVNHEKYGNCEFLIPKGTPYAQVIPFKRDDWKMKIKSRSTKKSKQKIWQLSFLNRYKNLIFNRGKSSWT